MPAALAEESPTSGLFAKLAGGWRGMGILSGMSADMRMNWEPVLDGQFQRLTLDNRMSGEDGKSWHFKAQAFYRIGKDGGITGTWFDSRGISQPLTGAIESDTLLISWGTEATESGRSSYRLSSGSLDVVDEVLTKDGEWRIFGRTKLTRQH